MMEELINKVLRLEVYANLEKINKGIAFRNYEEEKKWIVGYILENWASI